MRTTNLRTTSILLLWSVAAPVCAQGPAAAALPTLGTALATTQLAADTQRAQTTLRDPSLTSPARMTDLQAILAATRTDTRAEIEIGVELAEDASKDREFRASFKLGGPVSKDDKEPELATLEGLANQASLSAGLRWVLHTPEAIRRATTQRIEDLADAQIRDLLEKAWLAENPGKSKDGVPDALSTDDISPQGRRKVLRQIIGDNPKGTWFFSGEATYAAPTTFKFTKAETLERLEEEHDGWTAAVSGSWLPVVSPMPFVGFNYRYEDSHKPQDKRQICSPFGTTGALACDNLVIGAPAALRKHLAQLEFRRFFPKATAGIGLRVTHDIENSVTGAELPVWVLRDGAGLLNGGVAVGWRSDTEAWTFSAFVGSPFGRE